MVTNPDGRSVTQSAGFEIVDGGFGYLVLDLIGQTTVRVGRPVKFYAVVRNEGLVDLELVLGQVTAEAGQERQSVQPLTLSQSAQLLSRVNMLVPVLPPGIAAPISVPATYPSLNCGQVRAAASDQTNVDEYLAKLEDCIRNGTMEERDRCCDEVFVLVRATEAKREEYIRLLGVAGFARLRAKLLELLDLCANLGSSEAAGLGERGTPQALFAEVGSVQQTEASLTVCAVNPVDPNDKNSVAGSGEARYVRGTIPLMPYTVFFENLATATAAATEVLITDQLDPNLDWSTFALDTIRVGEKTVEAPEGTQNFSTTLDLRPAISALVEVDLNLNPSTGRAEWLFRGKDPDTGELTDFLPPNTADVAPRGEGAVSYSVKPRSNLPTGTVIRNKATIDFEVGIPPAPEDTPEVFNTIDSDKPSSQVLPLSPTQATTGFEVQWSGADEGSGIRDYTIFVAEDGSPYIIWLRDTIQTSAAFTGQPGKTYAFYSVARDKAGNVKEAPTTPDAITRIALNRPPVADAGADQTVEATSPAGATVTLNATGSSDPDGDTLSYTWTGPFGSASGATPTVSLPLGSHTITLEVSDGKGGSANDTVDVTVQDTTAPTATLGVVAGTLGGNGWYRSDVTVRTSGMDSASGIASCTADQVLTADSAASTFNGACTDNAGNSGGAQPLTVKRDATQPTTTGQADVSGTQATVTLTASDNLSGIADTRYSVNGGETQPYTGPFVVTGVGTYTISFFSTDGAGNVELAKTLNVTIAPALDACTTTNLLDNFNRANGSLGSNWRGLTGTSFYRIAGNRLDVQAGGPVYWNLATLGTGQAASVNIATVDTKSRSQGVLLKVQSGDIPNAGAIAAVYDAVAKSVRVSTFRLGARDWTPYGNTSAILNNGDKLGACAKDNGEVRIYKNEVLVRTVTLNAADQAFFNGKGGKVGLWSVVAPNAFFDDFGGGTIVP